MTFLHHEQIYRGKGILDKIKVFPLGVCGIGAIGSNLVENLIRQGFGNITAVDGDRIEERNINTQIWAYKDIGALKTQALEYRVFDIAKTVIAPIPKMLNKEKQFKRFFSEKVYLMIDAFDNSKSRQLVKDFCLKAGIDCLHIGFSGGYGEIIWNEDYRVPDDKGVDDCDYPLARNLILLLVAVASETIIKYVVSAIKENYTITLGDFRVERYKS